MRKLLSIAAIFSSVVFSQAQVLFHDDFTAGFDPAWVIIRPDTNYYTINPTELDLLCSSANTDTGTDNTAKNLFTLTNPAAGNFTVTLKVNSFVPANNNYAQMDIIVLDDEDNFVRLNYGYIGGQRQFELGREINASWVPQTTPLDLGSNPFYMRLTKTGTTYVGSYSTDGTNYITPNISVTYGNGFPGRVGFLAGADPSQSSHAHLDAFTVEIPPLVLTNLTILTAVELAWPTVLNKTYQVQSSPALSPAKWSNVGDPIAGTGSNSFLLQSTRIGDKNFYQVITSP